MSVLNPLGFPRGEVFRLGQMPSFGSKKMPHRKKLKIFYYISQLDIVIKYLESSGQV